MENPLCSCEIREGASADDVAIEALYPRAFPEEDLLPLVRDLLGDTADCLSLVAIKEARIAGHAAFTRCGVEGSGATLSLLGPLAVDPADQRQGVGTALVETGLRLLADNGVDLVCVLGDPRYYGRLGFEPERGITPPYPLPDEWQGAWQSRWVGESTNRPAGKLLVPSPWLQPALWAP